MPAVRVDSLHVTPLLQTRAGGVCRETVQDYTTFAKGGAKFPPVLAFRVTDRKFPGPALVAGFHRIAAYKAAGVEECDAEIREGTFADAWVAGWLSNLSNGLRYTNADKRKAAEQALKLFRTDSATQVAERIRVSDEFIRKVRKELVAAGALEGAVTITAKDGRVQSTTHKSSGQPKPTLGIGSDDDDNDDVPVVESVHITEPDDDPADYITLDSLAQLAQTAADNHEYESAVEYQAERIELAALLEKHGGFVIRVPKQPPPMTGVLPKPMHDASPPSNGRPSWFKGGNNTDPDHPYADLLKKFTALTRAITEAVNDPDDDRIRVALTHASQVKRKTHMIAYTSDVIADDEFKGGTAKFIGLGPLRNLVRKAGKLKNAMKPDQVAKAFDEGNDPKGKDDDGD